MLTQIRFVTFRQLFQKVVACELDKSTDIFCSHKILVIMLEPQMSPRFCNIRKTSLLQFFLSYSMSMKSSIDRIHGKCSTVDIKKLLPIKQWAFFEGVWLVQDTSVLETVGKLPPDLSRCLGCCHQVSGRPKFGHILRSNLRNFDLSTIFLAVSIVKHQSCPETS